MALQWADFPSGQPGIYGSDSAQMLNGTPWVNLVSTGLAQLRADPDTANFPNGIVWNGYSTSSGPAQSSRLAIDTPHQKVGVASRVWFPSLPSDGVSPVYSLNNTSNGSIYCVGVRPNGGVEIAKVNTSGGGWTALATADYPVILAKSWNHMEFVGDVVTGALEVRVNGEPLLTATDATPPGGTIGIVAFPEGRGQSPFGSAFKYIKDLIVYNGAGSQFNNFQGTVSVSDIRPESDSTLGGWTTSSGATGWNLIDESTPDDADYIQSAVPPTSPAVFNMTNLDPDIVSVRGLLMIARGLNSDSGDGFIQMGVSPDGGVNTDLGATHALTSTARYRFDTSELSPATGTPWTPTEVNALTLQFNRTT